MKIVVIGAGIAGLSAAHYLSQNSLLKIIVIEQSNVCGGSARTFKDSWGVSNEQVAYFSTNYHTMNNIMSQVDNIWSRLVLIKSAYLSTDKSNCMKSNLWPIFAYIIKEFGILWLTDFLFNIFNSNIDALRNITWVDYIHKLKFHPKQEAFIVDIWSVLLGVDPVWVSASTIVEFLQTSLHNVGHLAVLDGPTNPTFFDKWKVFLEARGIKFLMNHKVLSIQQNHILAYSLTAHKKIGLFAHHIISAIPPLNLSTILPRSSFTSQMQILGELMAFQQIALPFLLTNPLNFKEIYPIVYLVDTPWQIVIQPTYEFWNPRYLPKATWQIKVGLGNPYKQGRLLQKPWPKCCLSEIQEEVWYEIMNVNMDCLQIPKHTKVIHVSMPDNFIWDNNTWKAIAPKCSSNAATWNLRPKNPQDNIPWKNIWLAGDYLAYKSELINMESAALSGFKVAKAVMADLKKQNK